MRSHRNHGQRVSKRGRQRVNDCFALSEAEISEFYARVESARTQALPQRRNVIERMRVAIEKRYGPRA